MELRESGERITWTYFQEHIVSSAHQFDHCRTETNAVARLTSPVVGIHGLLSCNPGSCQSRNKGHLGRVPFSFSNLFFKSCDHWLHHGGMKGMFFFSSRRRHTRLQGDWSSDVCSSD